MPPTTIAGPARAIKEIALIGHPNVGKSVIFHCLTGKYVTVSNYPGTTVDLSRGVCSVEGQDWRIYDSPGVVSLYPKTDDERVTRDLLIETQPDVVIQVADAKNLSKALHLTFELAEFGLPMVLALNMADEALDRGISIDVDRLSKWLGIPVVMTVAITGDGIDELREALLKAAPLRVQPRHDPALAKTLSQIESHFNGNSGKRSISTSLLLNDKTAWPHAVRMLKGKSIGALETDVKSGASQFVRPLEMLIFEAKQHVIQEIVGESLSVKKSGGSKWLATFGNWCMRPFPGYLIAAGALYALYQFVGIFGAGTLVGFLEENVFGNWLNPWVTQIVQATIPIPLIQEALVGEYGTFTMALTYAFALILPIVTTFFLFFGVMEDSGYLPRLAVMMDRFFRLMGLNGRAILPMVLGLGCDTMATVTTRILDTKKEKIILSLLLTLAVPCSAQLGAILGMAAGLSWRVWFVWFAVLSATMITVGGSVSKLLPGARSPFLCEIPPLRIPKLINILKKIKMRLKWYLKEVIPLFVLATFVLFVLDKLTLLSKLTQAFSPIVVSFLGLPAKASEAFLIGFFRRDYGAAGFFKLAESGAMTAAQVAVSMVVVTLFMPCIAHLLITIKERGLKTSLAIASFVMIFALLVGGLVNWLLQTTKFI